MSLSDSQLAMWQGLVSLIHADGQKHPEEDEFIRLSMKRAPATEDQKAKILEGLENPQPIDEIFPRIKDGKDRSQFIYLARVLFWSDGNFDGQEQKIFDRLQEKTMSQVNLKSAMKEVDSVAERFEQRIANEKSARPWSQILVDALVFWKDLH